MQGWKIREFRNVKQCEKHQVTLKKEEWGHLALGDSLKLRRLTLHSWTGGIDRSFYGYIIGVFY
mgnify:CR=1 FL=1